MEEKEQAPRTEQEQKSISVRSHCNTIDDPIEQGTQTRSVQSKVAEHGSRVSSLVDEGSLMSERVESSANCDRRSHRYTSNETNHDGRRSRSRYKYNDHSQERRRDNYDSDLHRHRRSSLDERKRWY